MFDKQRWCQNKFNKTFFISEEKRADSLKNVSVELQFAVAQELSDHLPAQAFPLQQEVSHPDGRVRHEAARDQEVDAFLRVAVTTRGKRLRKKKIHQLKTQVHDNINIGQIDQQGGRGLLCGE